MGGDVNGDADAAISQRIALIRRLADASKETGRLTISLEPEQAEWLQSLLAHDPETEAMSKDHFLDRVRSEWSRTVRTGCDLSLVVIGLPDVGSPQDLPARSRQLRSVVGTLTRQLRAWGDALGRLDVSELAILLPETGEKGAQDVVRRIRPALAQASRLPEADLDMNTPAPRIPIGWITLRGSDAGFGWKWAVETARSRMQDDLRAAASTSADPL